MPTCKKCDMPFKNRQFIDGKMRMLCKRKYCLSCSPFGLHNTIKLEDIGKQLFIVCNICARKYEYNRTSGHSKTTCNSCLVNIRRFKLKKKSIDYKGGKCKKCGYNKCFSALDFHHRNQDEKDFSISGMHCISWQRMRKELDKCDLLCANCHREQHAKNRIARNRNNEQ